MIKDYKLKDNKLYFTSDVPPSTNHYNSWRVIQMRGKNMPSAYPSKEYKSFKKSFRPYLEEMMGDIDWDILPTKDTHYYLDIVMYFDRRDKDPNNYFKCPMDVMNEIVYVDDRTIISRVARMYYTNNLDCPPHFEYELYPVDYIGIWDSQNEYDIFLKRCLTCRNYKDHKCKRLSEFETYKYTKDFDMKTRQCLGYKCVKTK